MPRLPFLPLCSPSINSVNVFLKIPRPCAQERGFELPMFYHKGKMRTSVKFNERTTYATRRFLARSVKSPARVDPEESRPSDDVGSAPVFSFVAHRFLARGIPRIY